MVPVYIVRVTVRLHGWSRASNDSNTITINISISFEDDIAMTSSQKAKVQEIIDTTQEPDDAGGVSGSDNEDDGHSDIEAPVAPSDDQPSTSQKKKKKKKKSKALKALNALKGKKEIPQSLVDQVLDKVKAEHGDNIPGADEENVRLALEQMKIMDVVQGKAGIGGINRKDMGEHKVCTLAVHL